MLPKLNHVKLCNGRNLLNIDGLISYPVLTVFHGDVPLGFSEGRKQIHLDFCLSRQRLLEEVLLLLRGLQGSHKHLGVTVCLLGFRSDIRYSTVYLPLNSLTN